MNTVEALMRDYLMRLETAAAGLPDEVRRDVLDDVETHLEEVLAGDPSEAEVLEALDRLGTAEEIAASAGPAWTAGEKALGTLPLWIALFGAPVAVGIMLLRRAHRRGGVGPMGTAVGRGGVV